MFGTGLTRFITLPEWLDASLGGGEVLWAGLYSLALLGILLLSFVTARRFLGTGLGRLLRRNTDALVHQGAG